MSRRRKSRRISSPTPTAARCIDSLEKRTLLAAAFTEFVDPNPSADNGFGVEIVPLSTGNVVITSPHDDAGGTDAGAVYLFNGATGELISTLTGSQANDRIGFSSAGKDAITPLANGNYVIASRFWSNGSVENAGAVTFGNGTTGVSGVVSLDNSLVGSAANQGLGATGLSLAGRPQKGVVWLPNGDYVVTSEKSPNGATQNSGSVTHGNGTTGTTGVISTANSLMGTREDDSIADVGIWVLTNGNYVISSSNWDSDDHTDAGAVTFVNGDSGLTGTIDETNSLVGAHEMAQLQEVTVLNNGNYVVSQFNWRNAAGDMVGAVTLADGTTGLTGFIDPAKSLTGSSPWDAVSRFGVTALTNGNYIVTSPGWDNGELTDAGAVTWQSGTMAIGTVVSAANSLVGGSANARVGNGVGRSKAKPLTNGNAVFQTIVDNVITTTFINGTTGSNGLVSAENSLILDMGDVGVSFLGGGNQVTPFPNGNYLVGSVANPPGQETTGALTLGNGETGVSGVISEENSLVGFIPNLRTPPGAVANSNFVAPFVSSRALYFGSGIVPLTGQFSIGDAITFSNSVVSTRRLTNGNFVIETSGGPPNTYLVDGNIGLSGEVPVEGRIEGRNVRELPNGNYIMSDRTSQHLLVGDGENTGVSAAVLSNGFDGGYGLTYSPVNVSDDKFVVLNFSYDVADQENVGSIIFIDGNPDFASGFADSNFFAGLRAGFTQNVGSNYWETVTDEVNDHFYVGFSANGVSRVVAGSTIDGFATEATGPEVNLSVSLTSGTEADQSQITVTATAASPVTADQTVVLATGGTGITSGDFALSGQIITIPDGQTTGSVTLTIRPDFLPEGSETLELRLANPSVGISLGTTIAQSITIEDDTSKNIVLDAVPRFPTDKTPTFTWNDVGVDRYEVWLQRTSSSGGTLRLQQETRFVTGTSYLSTEVLTAGLYKIWVRVFDSNGIRGPWSRREVFEYRPTLLAPLSAVATSRPTFTWEKIPGAAAYQIWIGTATGRVIESDIVDTSWTPSHDLAAGDIRWWIRDMASTLGGWSDVGRATVGGAAPRPRLLSPLSAVAALRPTFNWEAVPGAQGYQIWVSTNSGAVVRSDSVGTSWTPSQDLSIGNIYWWVRDIAVTNDGWSDVGTASVGGLTTIRRTPGHQSNTNGEFTWQPVTGSSRYILHVQDRSSGDVVIREDNLTTNSFTPATMLPSGNFRVWVKVIRSSGEFNDGAWSAPVDFTIAAVTEQSTPLENDLLFTSLSQVLEIIPPTTTHGVIYEAEAQSHARQIIVEDVVEREAMTQSDTVLSDVVPQSAALGARPARTRVGTLAD